MPLLRSLFLSLSFLLIAMGTAQADLYKRIDDQGHVFFTDKPEGPGYKLIMRTPRKGTLAYKKFQQNRRALTPLIQRQARESKVDPALVMAVIHAESAYDQYARSHAGAVGLMQLMPATAERFGVSNRTNVTENIRGGTQYLRYLLELFEFNIRLTLAAYNAGESAVSKYGNTIPPYPETQLYIKKVIGYYRDYLGQRKSS